MSYDVWIGDKSFNYTSNVSRLWYDHIPDEGKGGGLREIDGLTGRQAATLLGEAFDRIHSTKMSQWENHVKGEPKFCALYDAENGWGSAVGGLIFMGQIMAACQANPRKKVGVWA